MRRPHIWEDREVWEPEQWTVTFRSPSQRSIVNWSIGNSFAHIERQHVNGFATLEKIHLNNAGLGTVWIIIGTTIAGALILQAATGVLLWTRLHGSRLLSIALMLGVGLITVGLVIAL